MKIALVCPRSTFLENPMIWPPLGLFYIAAQLEVLGHKVEYFDQNHDGLPIDGVYDQLWISSTSPQIADVRRIAEITKDWKKTKTVVGGAGPWANLASFLDLGLDLVVAGEADNPQAIETILSSESNFILLPIVKDLNFVLPPVRRWTTKYHSYMYDENHHKYRMASLFTTRGCPMSCAFCESGRNGVIWDSNVRYESVDVVEWQIKECKELGFTGLAYYDDIFILNKRRTLQLLDLHHKYEMKFRCFLRSDILSKHGGKDYLKELKDGGLIECFVGVESADNEIKKNIHKGTTIEQDQDVLNWCKELGITCKMSVILGLPGETIRSMMKTKQWILSQDPKGMRVQVDRLIPYPGTPLTKNPKDYDLWYDQQIDEDWFFRGRMDLDSKSFVNTSNLSRYEIDYFWRKLEKELVEKGYSV